jgi:hypothetical protein
MSSIGRSNRPMKRTGACAPVAYRHKREVASASRMDVFVLQHVNELEDAAEDVKFIGVYSSEDAAREAVARLGRQPGFCDHPDGFHIDRYRVDADHWVEGFGTITSR